jgi:prolyl-tRNA synthetase
MTEADSGAMGGSVSHEFMVPSEIGEDVLFKCKKCENYYQDTRQCPDCKEKLISHKHIEIGHIFKLGTKYSQAQQAFFLDENGKRRPFIMGCYGIGVSRILAAIAEVSSDDKGIIWPRRVAPFDVSLLLLDEGLKGEAFRMENTLGSKGYSVLVDERSEAAGVKFNDAYLIGSPYIIIMGKNYKQDGKLDVEIRKSRKTLSFNEEDVVSFLKDEYGK